MLVFPRVHFKDFMLKGTPPGSIGGAKTSVWSNERPSLRPIFGPLHKAHQTLQRRAGVDNHETHLSVEAVEKAGVVIVTFPPHTSHRLQPLDISVYSPFKSYHNQGIDSWLINNPGKIVDIYSVSENSRSSFPTGFQHKQYHQWLQKVRYFSF